MAKAILAIPEESVQEVIDVILSGLTHLSLREVSFETKEQLLLWCKEQTEYLNRN